MQCSHRASLRQTFDEVAAVYERVRPSYPERLFGDLVELGDLPPGARLLEIGCGTGQATSSLARRGYSIVCVELGESLAAVARRKLTTFPDVRIVTSPFESWDPGGSTFDLVLAATSWHWLDPDARYVKAATVLGPVGALAIVTTHHVLPDDGDQFFVEIQDAYERIAGEVDTPPPSPDEVGDERKDIEASGLFGDVRVRRYLSELTYTPDEYIALLDTYSGHRAMPPTTRQALYQEIRQRIAARSDGRVRKHYLFTLQVARLGSRPPDREVSPLTGR